MISRAEISKELQDEIGGCEAGLVLCKEILWGQGGSREANLRISCAFLPRHAIPRRFLFCPNGPPFLFGFSILQFCLQFGVFANGKVMTGCSTHSAEKYFQPERFLSRWT
ncbi:hypothetical protein CEXT_274581 [Caerostris extrusa]|uniref:Uncharacterized protein n=1 Tax=Caerostris extrusa TaxID=172846 RepID=A0AAV4X5F2_CAEEX|nr:hypothetical protein CEXT_274581 [Caerostris extrusa]